MEPPPLNLSGPRLIRPFLGCRGIIWNDETKVLYLLSEPTTPMVYQQANVLQEFIKLYNHPTGDELVKRHVLYKLLVEITYTRTDLHKLILDILTSGNLPTKMEESFDF